MLKILVTVLSVNCALAQNNVCNTFEGYAHIDSSKDCWHNPNVGANTEQILNQGHYNYETHTVDTADGYQLTVFRLLPTNSIILDRVVYLHHGIYTDSALFLLSGNKSLAYQLVQKGYDVWLGNSRGSQYSMGHKHLTTKDKQYWDFSVHELGFYDLPATLSYIRRITRLKTTYIGYSMGTTLSYIYASSLPKHAQVNVKAIISLAPVVKFESYNSPIAFAAYIEKYIEFKTNLVQVYSVNKDLQFTRLLLKICSTYPDILSCSALIATVCGWTDKISPSTMPLLASAVSSGSTNLVYHYAQILKNNGRFAQFSYGIIENIKKYKSAQPPLYDLQNVTLPIRLFYGSSDPFTSEKSIQALYDAVSSKDKRMTRIPSSGSRKFNHADFILAEDSGELLYEQLFSTLDELYNTHK